MKRNDKTSKRTKSKISGRVKLLVVLMFFSATMGWAKEQQAEVVRVLDIPHPDDGTTTTQVMVDSYENGRSGRPEMSIHIHNSTQALFSILLKEYLPVGAVFSYDDAAVLRSGYTSDVVLSISGLLSINGENILDLLPEFESLFRYATERKRAEAARQNQQRGSR
jgi:hypothetical protein